MSENVSKEKIITITLPTDTYFISGIRDMTMTLIRSLGKVPTQWAYRFQSVVDELSSNAIEHGSKNSSNILIRYIIIPEEKIEVVVEDTGGGKNAKNAKEIEEHVKKARKMDFSKAAELRGRGLAQIVASWTDELLFEDREGGGLRVRAIKSLVGIEQESDQAAFNASKTKTGFVSIYE